MVSHSGWLIDPWEHQAKVQRYLVLKNSTPTKMKPWSVQLLWLICLGHSRHAAVRKFLISLMMILEAVAAIRYVSESSVNDFMIAYCRTSSLITNDHII